MSLSTLPRHRYSSFSDLLTRFEGEHVPKRMRWLFRGTVALWRRIFGVDEAEKIIAEDFSADRDGFWHADWLWKELFYPEISATFVGDARATDDPIWRCAQLIYGATHFYLKVKAQSLEPDVFAGRPQDMSRYAYLFSRLTLFRLEAGSLRHRITDLPPSDYVVVGLHGQVLKLAVLRGDEAIGAHELYLAIKAFERNLTQGGLLSYVPPLGLLTALQNRQTFSMWQTLEASNPRSIAQINGALFSASIDFELKPKTIDQTLSGLNSRVGIVRDCRRSFQLIVAGNGAFGAVVNPHAGIGGTLSARLVAELAKACTAVEPLSADAAHAWQAPSEWLPFTDSGLAPSAVLELERTIGARLYPVDTPTSFRLEGIGSRQLAAAGMHADAAFHAALSLAWFRMRGYAPTIGNFINLRSTQFGDIWRYDATTQAMQEFVKSPSLAAFRRAERAHIDLIKKHKPASDEFYLSAMALKRLVCDSRISFSAFVSLVLICSVFVKNFVRRFLNPDLWVSCIPSLDGVKAAGRGGSMMSYLAKTSTGGHYMIFDDYCLVCLMNAKNGRWLGTEAALAQSLQQALVEVSQLS